MSNQPIETVKTIPAILSRMKSYGKDSAFFWKGQEHSYDDFFAMCSRWEGQLSDLGVGHATVCSVLGDYSPETCALFFALIKRKAILVPFTPENVPELPELMNIAGVQCQFTFSGDEEHTFEWFKGAKENELVNSFKERNESGLIVFTSGSTGRPKGIMHDCERVFRKFLKPRTAWRTVLFLKMDHFGGFNTLLSTASNGGLGVCLHARTPESVCKVIQDSRATLLPTTPTFLNVLIASKAWESFDLSSIRLITYGAEVMTDTTLRSVHKVFPNVELKQTYGMSELGVLRSKSKSADSTWVKVGGDGFETKIIDNVLWVRSESNMVGYLNAPNPFGDDGWLCTGDNVEVQEDMIRFLGRDSDMINVGGQKVFPVEVETVLLQADNVMDIMVYGVSHPLLGQVPCARVFLENPEDPGALTKRLRKFCMERLNRYKVPMRFTIVDEEQMVSGQIKKNRRILDERT